MAEDKTTRSTSEPSVSDALAAGAADLDASLRGGRERVAGYTPADAAPEPADETDAGLPGEDLAHDLADPEPFEVVDDEAEELGSGDAEAEAASGSATVVAGEAPEAEPEPTGRLDPAELEAGRPATTGEEPAGDAEDGIDDPAQLADAEAVAVAAKSTRPAKRKKAAAGTVGEATAEDETGHPVTSRPARKTATATAPARKTARTPSRKESAPAPGKRTTPAQFVRESVAELRKVVWPTGTQVQQYFLVVLVFVLFIIAFVGLLDLGLGWLLLKLLG